MDIKIFKRAALPEKMVVKYWLDVIEADLLKYRISDFKDRGVLHLQKMFQRQDQYMFYVLSKPDGGYLRIYGEFTVIPFRGRSAVVHFSVHPSNSFKENAYLCKTVTDRLLNPEDGKPDEDLKLKSLLGFTPVHHRRACLLVKHAAFRRVGTVPSAGYYLGEICDAVLSVKEARC